jgi:tRNA/rRNA methyltransferase
MGKTNKDQLGNKINFDFTSNLPAVILVKPQLGENIGAVCRCMLNFRSLRITVSGP